MVVFSLTLVRHGETAANRDGIIQGHQDVPLSDIGIKQARLVAARLQHEPFTHIFASDLKRAAQTAQIIAEANISCQCSVQLDKRLRERKFGVFEGQTFKDLMQAAKKQNLSWASFTPAGAETFEQVHQRAKSFFRSLCQLMSLEGTTSDGDYIPASIKSKRRHEDGLSNNGDNFGDPTQILSDDASHLAGEAKNGTSYSNNTRRLNSLTKDTVEFKRPRIDKERQPIFEITDTFSQEFSAATECDSVEASSAGVFLSDLPAIARSNSSSSSSGCSSLALDSATESHEPDLPTPVQDDERDDTDSSDTGFEHFSSQTCCIDVPSCSQPVCDNKSSQNVPSCYQNVFSASVQSSSFSREFSASCSVFGPPSMHFKSTVDVNRSLSKNGHTMSTFTTTSFSSQMCPNVSLSPLLEHRINSLSSVSSGRNSSFDDADMIPTSVGDVLVVSHGGFLKELVAHFIEDFHCKVPGGKSHALRICPNTSVSRFMVTLAEFGQPPTVTCLLIHDKDHLRSLNLPQDTQGKTGLTVMAF